MMMLEVRVDLMSFHVTVRKDEAGYYVARCAELPAAMTQGRTEEEVIRNIKEAIHLVLEATLQNQEIPKPVVKQIELVA
jgi:predicted RNase H-like HicB family nuclease